jgi:hypothetical protein
MVEWLMAAHDFEEPVSDPEFPSGEWVGFYQDRGSKHRQEMHLTFRGGTMRGDGADDIGHFVVRGGYDTATKNVWWTKTYPGSHSVAYRGYREIRGIWGLWQIPPTARDGFHIWPRARGEESAETAAAAAEQPRRATVLA